MNIENEIIERIMINSKSEHLLSLIASPFLLCKQKVLVS